MYRKFKKIMFMVHLGYNYYESLLIGYAYYCPLKANVAYTL